MRDAPASVSISGVRTLVVPVICTNDRCPLASLANKLAAAPGLELLDMECVWLPDPLLVLVTLNDPGIVSPTESAPTVIPFPAPTASTPVAAVRPAPASSDTSRQLAAVPPPVPTNW